MCVSGAGVATNISVVETKDKHGAKSSSKMAFLKLHGDRFLFFKTYVKIGTLTMGHCFVFFPGACSRENVWNLESLSRAHESNVL